VRAMDLNLVTPETQLFCGLSQESSQTSKDRHYLATATDPFGDKLMVRIARYKDSYIQIA
jgi:hypothetical protein